MKRSGFSLTTLLFFVAFLLLLMGYAWFGVRRSETIRNKAIDAERRAIELKIETKERQQ